MQSSTPSAVEALVIGDGMLLDALKALSAQIPLKATSQPALASRPSHQVPEVVFVCVPAQNPEPSLECLVQLAGRDPDIPLIGWMEIDDEDAAVQAIDCGADETLTLASATAASVRAVVRRAAARARRRAEWMESGDIPRVARMAAEKVELRNFFNHIIHDLHAPLVQIKSLSDLAESAVRKNDKDKALDHLWNLRLSAKSMGDGLRRFLDFSEATAPTGALESVNLNAVVKDVLTELDEKIRRTGARVVVRELPTVRARRRAIHQLLFNLLDNAATFPAPGAAPLIEIGSARAPEGWRLWVSDQGLGIPADELDGIFDLARRGPSDGTPRGLGLAICRHIVEGHGGRLWAESEPGRGACFYFTLPIS